MATAGKADAKKPQGPKEINFSWEGKNKQGKVDVMRSGGPTEAEQQMAGELARTRLEHIAVAVGAPDAGGQGAWRLRAAERRRDALCGGLARIGWDVPKPKGTMFVWAELPDAFRPIANLGYLVGESVPQGGNRIELHSDTERFVVDALRRHPMFEIAARPARMTRLLFSRYEPGMTYGAHTDDALMGPSDDKLRTDLAFTLFLEDADKYEGGALVIESALGE